MNISSVSISPDKKYLSFLRFMEKVLKMGQKLSLIIKDMFIN